MTWPDLVLIVYFTLWLVLAVHGGHRVWLLWLYRRPRPKASQNGDTSLGPVVTIQLPIFNEYHVVERLLAHTVNVRYPAGRLEIQVLDDSTDETALLTRRLVEEYQSQGVDIHWMHRSDRVGFKAGALEAGLKIARGEYVAVFDADFLPQKDFLEKTVPWLVEGYGMVQTRWSHINLKDSWLTRVQGTLLDGHFVVEHAARCYGDRWFNFNGTAGIWKKTVIEDAGGWQHDTLTEDLDLSYRAQMKGHRFLYLENVLAPAELPGTIAAFKAQQHRWAKGSVQTGKKLIARIWSAKVPLRHKIEATFHLTANVGHPSVLALALLIPWAVVSRGDVQWEVSGFLDLILFTCATTSLFLFYGVAILRSGQGNVLRRWLSMPVVMAAAIGISISQTRAVMEGLWGETGSFVRTPKWGGKTVTRYKSAVHWVVWIECLVALYLWIGLAVVLWDGWWKSAPFVMLFAMGYTMIGVGSLIESYRSVGMKWRSPSTASSVATGTQVIHQSQTGSIQVSVGSE